jgi:hypothetical protein
MPPAAAIAPRWPIPRRYRKHGRARAGTTSSLVHPRERRPFHQLENERANAICVLDSIDRGDVRVIQRRENLPLPLEALQTRFILREGLGKNLDRDFALQLPVRGLYTSPIPPAPSAPRISYEPRRVPAVRLMRFGSSAGEKDSVRGEAGPQCAPGQPSPGLFSTLEAPSPGLRSLSRRRRTFVLSFVLSDTALTSNVTTDSNRFIQPLARRSMNLLSFPGRIPATPAGRRELITRGSSRRDDGKATRSGPRSTSRRSRGGAGTAARTDLPG